MTKIETRKVAIILTTEEQKTLASASAIMAQLVETMYTDEVEYALYCELEDGCDVDYTAEELDKMVGALHTIANNPLEIA